MNKASFSPHHTQFRVILVFLICILPGLVPIDSVRADAAPPPDPTVGGVGPYQPQKTNVQMMSEKVFIDVPHETPEQLESIRVNAVFVMRNQGQSEEQMQVIFPLSRLAYDYNSEQSVYRVKSSSFTAKANGQPLPISEITTPAEIPADGGEPKSGYTTDVLWAAFPVTFPVGQDVWLQVEYEMANVYPGMGEYFTGVDYILETGAGWYGSIVSAEIKVRLPYQVAEEALRYVKPGYTISGRELHWTFKDLEPTREDNLYVRFVQEGAWKGLSSLISETKNNPYDAEAWEELAGWYEYLSMIYPIGPGGFPYQLNHRTSGLAVEARRRVAALRPGSGDAHFKLAEILWYTNPKVEDFWDLSGQTLIPIEPDDPSIQEVLYELDQGWSYGLSENLRPDVERLVVMINRTVPGLDLMAPGIPTATVTLPPATGTPVPTATETSSPAASPTFTPEPVISPTPAETTSSMPVTNYGLLIVVLGILAAGGTALYLWRSKI